MLWLCLGPSDGDAAVVGATEEEEEEELKEAAVGSDGVVEVAVVVVVVAVKTGLDAKLAPVMGTNSKTDADEVVADDTALLLPLTLLQVVAEVAVAVAVAVAVDADGTAAAPNINGFNPGDGRDFGGRPAEGSEDGNGEEGEVVGASAWEKRKEGVSA